MEFTFLANACLVIVIVVYSGLCCCFPCMPGDSYCSLLGSLLLFPLYSMCEVGADLTHLLQVSLNSEHICMI